MKILHFPLWQDDDLVPQNQSMAFLLRSWPTVQRRVLENQEPLRKVADDYGVSYETVRRTVIASRKEDIR